jgi:DNA replication and repair protein RecF
MRLEKLQLLNFKNYEEVNLNFPYRINVLVGKNGSGKTNLLDAIFYLSFTKSAFSTADQQCILLGKNFFVVKGEFSHGDRRNEISSSVQTGAKKVFREGLYDYQRLAEHIGKYPVILIAPDDVDLIKEGGESRRKFFDSIISQLDGKYLENLLGYNHILKQRNGYLRMASDSGTVDWVAIESYDHALVKYGMQIFERRSEFIREFIPFFKKFYKFIVDEEELADMEYTSELKEKDFYEGLVSARQKDLGMQRTTFGIHRDDFQFVLKGGELKRFGSQGQQKSFVIALKLAQFEIVEKSKGTKPILLLDDIFDKLDDLRIAKLLALIKTDLGQLFITDARPDRTKGLLDQIHVEAFIFTIENGKVKEYGEL